MTNGRMATPSETNVFKLYTGSQLGRQTCIHRANHPSAHPVNSHSAALTLTANATRDAAEVSKNGRRT